MLRHVLLSIAVTATAYADPPRAHAVRRVDAIAIDGRLDEPAWASAPKQQGFTQRFPRDGAKPSLDTSFAVLYDDDALYVGVWADDPEPDRIRRLLTRRDIDAPADTIVVGVDSYHDRRTAYEFQLNAAGVQRDMLVFDDQSVDDTWDAVWTGDVAVTDRGWTAEFRIPLSQLRFSDDAREWGFQVVRIIGRTQEASAWSPWPRSGPQIASRFGVVDGLDHVRQARRLELLPYATAGVDVEPIESRDPVNPRVSARRNLGLDLKYGLGPAFTLSATVNPDFGQVEADPSQVNLTGQELLFAEKRPFFLEGVDLFKMPVGVGDNPAENAFYSRRIGAVPATPDGDYQFIATPTATAIYAAAKLTGKTTSGWSIGALDAVTGPESVALVDATGARMDTAVAPLTNFAIARVKRDFGEGRTALSVSGTAVDRALDGALVTTMHDQAYTTGAQLQHRWADNAWLLELRSMYSWVHGSPDAIAATQTNTVHLFQRPDASDVHFDPARTSLAGLGASWNVGQLGDTKHWRYGVGGNFFTPGLELNDAGFQTKSDRFLTYVSGQYRVDEPTEDLLNWQVNADVFVASNFEPRLETYGVEYSANVQLPSYWTLTAGGNVAATPWDPIALRGGDALRGTPSTSAFAGVTTDTRRRVWITLNTHTTLDWVADAQTVGVDAGATIQARSNIDITVGPGYAWRNDPLQYIAEADDATGVHHYVFGRIHQSTASLTARVNWTFSPHLSLQVYAQPFVSAGRYSELKDVDNPHAARFADRFHLIAYTITDDTVDAGTYSFAKPDFDVRQLRSTVVLRWEYRPGSTVFAIWSHGQTSSVTDGSFRLGTDLAALVAASEQNIVMVKANYWLGL